MRTARCTDDGYEAMIDEILVAQKPPAPFWYQSGDAPYSEEYRKFVERLMDERQRLNDFYVSLAAQQEVFSFRSRFVHDPAFGG